MNAIMRLRQFDKLYLVVLDANGYERTGYWYLVQSEGAVAHTAFRTREACARWLSDRGLTITGGTVPHAGTVQIFRIEGRYRAGFVQGDLGEGRVVRGLHNGQYVPKCIRIDEDGVFVELTQHPPITVFPYEYSRAMEDRGF